MGSIITDNDNHKKKLQEQCIAKICFTIQLRVPRYLNKVIHQIDRKLTVTSYKYFNGKIVLVFTLKSEFHLPKRLVWFTSMKVV